MYSIQNFKILADLQEELASLETKKEKICNHQVHPSMKSAIEKLYLEIMDFFGINELKIIEEENGFIAEYKKATIAVKNSREGFALKLSINSREVDEIKAIVAPARYHSPKDIVKPDELEKEIVETQNKIQEAKSLLLSYENLIIIYANKANQTFKTSEEVLKKYFY